MFAGHGSGFAAGLVGGTIFLRHTFVRDLARKGNDGHQSIRSREFRDDPIGRQLDRLNGAVADDPTLEPAGSHNAGNFPQGLI